MSHRHSRRPDRRRVFPSLGAVLWISSIQYFVAQWWTARAWPTAYNLTDNFISDLGVTSCDHSSGILGRYVCSPAHEWMNASFILLGLSTALGALLLRPVLMAGRVGLISTALFVTSGIGLAMVGMNPENLAIGPHITGAYLDAYAGSLAIFVMGFAIRLRAPRTAFGTLNTLVGLCLMILMINYTLAIKTQWPLFLADLGLGALERLCDYPLHLWPILLGIVVLVKPMEPAQ